MDMQHSLRLVVLLLISCAALLTILSPACSTSTLNLVASQQALTDGFQHQNIIIDRSFHVCLSSVWELPLDFSLIY